MDFFDPPMLVAKCGAWNCQRPASKWQDGLAKICRSRQNDPTRRCYPVLKVLSYWNFSISRSALANARHRLTSLSRRNSTWCLRNQFLVSPSLRGKSRLSVFIVSSISPSGYVSLDNLSVPERRCEKSTRGRWSGTYLLLWQCKNEAWWKIVRLESSSLNRKWSRRFPVQTILMPLIRSIFRAVKALSNSIVSLRTLWWLK